MLGGVGCGGGQESATDNGASSAENSTSTNNTTNTQPDPTRPPKIKRGSPEQTVQQFIEACTIGDLVTALSLATEEQQTAIRTYNAGNPCAIPAESVSNSMVSSEQAGATHRVEWEWKTAEPKATIRYLFLLAEENRDWRIFSGDRSFYEEAPKTITSLSYNNVRIEPEITIVYDDTMPDNLSWIEAHGVMGFIRQTYEVVSVGLDEPTRALLTETVETEMQNHIIVRGSIPAEQFQASLSDALNNYMIAIQTADYATVQKMTIPDENLNFANIRSIVTATDFRIESFEIGETDYIGFEQVPDADRPTKLIGRDVSSDIHVYELPMYVRTLTPITVEFSLFGRPFSHETRLEVVNFPNEGWTMHNWILPYAGSKLDETSVQEGSTVTLKGLAVTPRGTFFHAAIEPAVDFVNDYYAYLSTVNFVRPHQFHAITDNSEYVVWDVFASHIPPLQVAEDGTVQLTMFTQHGDRLQRFQHPIEVKLVR